MDNQTINYNFPLSLLKDLQKNADIKKKCDTIIDEPRKTNEKYKKDPELQVLPSFLDIASQILIVFVSLLVLMFFSNMDCKDSLTEVEGSSDFTKLKDFMRQNKFFVELLIFGIFMSGFIIYFYYTKQDVLYYIEIAVGSLCIGMPLITFMLMKFSSSFKPTGLDKNIL
jgi:hypothetical protein